MRLRCVCCVRLRFCRRCDCSRPFQPVLRCRDRRRAHEGARLATTTTGCCMAATMPTNVFRRSTRSTPTPSKVWCRSGSIRPDTAATFQTTPLVADGVMYLSAPFSHVMAVDAATGAELWRYEHKSTAKKLCCGPANRGVALGYGKVYVATVDARLIALDQKTGKVIWDIAIVAPDGGPTEDAGVLAGDALKGQRSPARPALARWRPPSSSMAS